MKKSAVIILGSLVAAFVISITPVFAAEQPDLRIYYSENVGAGQKVYHITACKKTQAKTPLRCMRGIADRFARQCKVNEKINVGTIVKGCLISGTTDAQSQDLYPAVSVENYDNNVENCKEDPLKVQFNYVPEYAIVETRDLSTPEPHIEYTDESKWIIKSTLAWDTDPSEIPEGVMRNIYPDGKAKRFYRSTLCTTFDIAEGDNGARTTEEPPGFDILNTPAGLRAFYNTVKDPALELVNAGCDNDNSRGIIGTIEQSTPFNENASYSCSTRWRITGKTGSDILGKYISGIYTWAAGLVGIIVVLTMVYSGIQISVAAGNTALVDEAKNRIMKSLIGLVILFLSGLILYTINPSFFTG